MNKKSVLISPSSFAEHDKTPLQKLVNAGYHVIVNPYKRKLTKEEVKKLLSTDVLGTIAGLEPLDRDVIEGTNLKVISRVGSGLSNVDLDYCLEAGIKVCSTPDGPTTSVAELTIGLLFGMLRMIPQMNAALHEGGWKKQTGNQLKGKTVVIVGYGRIGRRLARLLRPFEVNLIVVDPQLKQEDLSGERLVTLKEALPLADILSFHNSGEACLVDDETVARMKQGVFIVNVARGGVLSEAALIRGITQGKIAGAALDVFEREPYRGELEKLPQVILTPHVGSYTKECRIEMENEAVNNLMIALQQCGEDG